MIGGTHHRLIWEPVRDISVSSSVSENSAGVARHFFFPSFVLSPSIWLASDGPKIAIDNSEVMSCQLTLTGFLLKFDL